MFYDEKNIFFEIHKGLPREGPGRNKYTCKAFQMLPPLSNPVILDIGCGKGGPTIELARLSHGFITGVDINQSYLDELAKKANKLHLSHRVKTLNCSMFNMDFPDETFDVIWAEGSIFIVGFEKGLRDWRPFIKAGGFLVVHEMTWLKPDPPDEILEYWKNIYPGIKTIQENLTIIPRCGYNTLGYFPLPADTWWIEYYKPLEKRIKSLKDVHNDDSTWLTVLAKEQKEIDMYRKFSKWYGSAFFVMQKNSSIPHRKKKR